MALFLHSFALCFVTLVLSQKGGGGGGDGGVVTKPDANDGAGNVGDTGSSADLCDLWGADASYQESIITDSSVNGGKLRNIVSSGCPNHYSGCLKPFCDDQNDPQTEAQFKNFNFSIPAYPCIAESALNVNCMAGIVGIMLNGVQMYSQFGASPCVDAVVEEADGFDACGGHASFNGDYHYHVTPACLAAQVDDYETPNPNGHSPQIGWALDGFPVYGRHGQDGQMMYPCTSNMSNSADCLDECNGHSHHDIDGFTYHYHVSGTIGDLESKPLSPLPSNDFNPYTIGCFKGVLADWTLISSNEAKPLCSSTNGYTDSYIASETQGITEIFDETYPSLYPSFAASTPSISPTPSTESTPSPLFAATVLSSRSDAVNCTHSVFLLFLSISYILLNA